MNSHAFFPVLNRCLSLCAALGGISGIIFAIAASSALTQQGAMAELQQANPPILALGLKQSTPQGVKLADGDYLYGQSAQPEQIGNEYLVFQLRQGKIRGAIYYPQSEFNCFTGAIAADQLKLSIRDPFDHRSYPYNIALITSDPIANRKPSQVNITLKGYFPLPQLSSNDHRLLQVCLN